MPRSLARWYGRLLRAPTITGREGVNVDFRDPAVTVRTIDELVGLGMDNERFRKLHHATAYENTIQAHRAWADEKSTRGGLFRSGHTNEATAKRLWACLEQRRAGVAWDEAIARALEQVPKNATPSDAFTTADLRPLVWDQMARLERVQLGSRERVSDQRDKFVLNRSDPRAAVLCSRPENRGFVRADRGGLLLRDASPTLEGALPRTILAVRMASEKGIEFRWTALGRVDVERIFDTVLEVAAAAAQSTMGAVQGRNRDQAHRRAIELHAMTKVSELWRSDGWLVEDVSSAESFDLRCLREGAEVHVEVKGTVGRGDAVNLTANEVSHAREFDQVVLCVVWGIEVDANGVAHGGVIRQLSPWVIDRWSLVAVEYRYTLPA